MRLILAYKNMAALTAISHIGLGVAALNTCKVLQSHGYRVEVWAVDTAAQLIQRITAAQADSVPITHFVMSAFPGYRHSTGRKICITFHRIQFACSSHSNVGFLQADPLAARFMTVDGPSLETGFPNFTLAANSQALCALLKAGYAAPCQYLLVLWHTSTA